MDSGASDNFIDPSLISIDDAHPLEHPYFLELFDGSRTSSGVITHGITLNIQFSSGSLMPIDFLITKLHPSSQVVLGLPWLQQTNPAIDWTTMKVSIPDLLTGSNVEAATFRTSLSAGPTPPSLPIPSGPTSSNVPQSPTTPENPKPDISLIGAAPSTSFVGRARTVSFSTLETSRPFKSPPPPTSLLCLPRNRRLLSGCPGRYHDYADVFSASEAEAMPPHRSYDHNIEIEEGSRPPHGPIYNMSESEPQNRS